MRCEQCKFWSSDAPLTREYGECRRNPPVLMREADDMVEDQGPVPAYRAMWPDTSATDWCGEFQPNPTDQPAEGA